ncbi:AraC family transcriptional regulator [Afipia sp. GAS231]|uniref:AraC family transcriptional regulator n=1 Tax=Afipia sp. GAS231 TaxID=1882747 RepID=UPI0008798D9B|nr:AraC family transcriptional regulator [Afipia sp. GAS231]SDO53539.1 AraC family transcriptional regulator [Afipia sp. GAS231]
MTSSDIPLKASSLSVSSLGRHYPIPESVDRGEASVAETRWQTKYDYGTIFYSPAKRSREHIDLEHHLVGVNLTPGIVDTRLNAARWSSNVMLSGSLYFVAAGSTIQVRKEKSLDCELASIDVGSANRLFEEAGIVGPLPAFSFNLIDPLVEAHARQLRRMLLQEDKDVPLVAASFVLQAIGRLMKCNEMQAKTRRYRLAPQQIRAALEFIEENLASSLSVEELAQHATGLSGFFFAHAFTEMLGNSPHQYVLARRLSRAYELIAKGKHPLAEIAYTVGFSSQAHMTTAFYKRFGVTPGALRRILS